MEDREIIALFLQRSEDAIQATEAKYGALCHGIAWNLLHCREDAAECENDAYLALWNAIPPANPQNFTAFLAKITRSIAIKRVRERTAKKRGGGQTEIPLDELINCLSDKNDFEAQLRAEELAELLGSFLDTLKRDERNVFVCRYWYCDSVADIASHFGFSKSKVKMILLRTRDKLSAFLVKEGVLL
jgi:RNA polymerase sigma-70 factor (ECF subfamily)